MTTVRLDLNNPEFQDQLFDLQRQERHQILNTLKKLRQMTWQHIYADRGLHWERILSREGPGGEGLYSIRMDQGFRAVVYRDGDWMAFLTLHPNHDSAYQ